MKRMLAVCAVLCSVVLVPVTAFAGGLNLSWNDCGTNGQTDQTFACNTNGNPPHILVGSYASPSALDSLNGNEIVLEMTTNVAGVIPDWWQVKNYTDGTVACRNPAASISFDFTSGPFSCNDYWSGAALGGFGIIRNVSVPNRQRILGVCAVGLSQAQPLAAELETYSFKITISNTKTVAPGAVCADCTAQACIQLNSILLTQNPGVPATNVNPITGMITPDVYVSNPLNASLATFQGNPGGGLCASVPVKNTTWGQVKNLYR